ncbi:hypothetical protein RB595_007919 [Gaeumannomyces hyphopodioides]
MEGMSKRKKADGWSEEQRVSMYMVHHVFFPPQLPGEDDCDAGLELQLLSTLLDCLESFASSFTSSSQRGAANSNAAMVRRMIRQVRNHEGTLDVDQLAAALGDLGESGGAVALHISSQNAGVIVSRQEDSVHFEVFELCPENQTVMASPGRLRRQFPDVSCRVPLNKFCDAGFRANIAFNLATLSQQSPPGIRPRVKKASQTHPEDRDTVDPMWVTEWLISGVLGPDCEIVGGQGFWKNVRDVVLWNNSFMPWRRSPTWLLARVAVQLIFSRESPASDPLYKSFVLFLTALILNKTPAAHLSSDHMHIMVAKIARRKHKLALVRTQADEKIVRYVDGCMNKVRAELARRQERLFHDPAPALHIAQLESLDFAQDVVHQLPDVDKFVKSIRDREKITRQTEFCRTGHPAEFKPDKLPTLSGTTPEYITATLAAFEKWVADHLDAWIATRALDWDACAKLGTLMKTYQGLAYAEYAKNPEGTSVLVLTVLELWIACDKSATALDSLLKEYSSRVPAQLLQSLLLPYRDQMCSLKSQMDNLKIDIHEWPLPNNPLSALATVFELSSPDSFSSWRDATAFLVLDVLHCRYQPSTRVSERHLDGYSALSTYGHGPARLGSQRISLCSSTKPHAVTHRNARHVIGLGEHDVCLNNGMSYAFYDKSSRQYVDQILAIEDKPDRCMYSLPPQSQWLEKYLFRPSTMPEGQPPNVAISNQHEKPDNFSLPEFRALVSVLLGHRIQWQNILVELAIPYVDFRKDETSLVLFQAMYQAGPPSEGSALRQGCHVLDDAGFSHELLHQLHKAAGRIKQNWESSQALFSFICVATRVLSLSSDTDVHEACLRFLLETRRIAFGWLKQVRTEAQSATKEGFRLELLGKTAEIALICIASFDIDEHHLHVLLHSPEDVSTLIQCSISAQECLQPGDLETRGSLLSLMIFRWKRVCHRASPVLSQVLTSAESRSVHRKKKSTQEMTAHSGDAGILKKEEFTQVTWSKTSKFAGEPESNRHVVVTVKKGACSGARAYQIDPQLGRLVDDGSFRSKVWLAYLHALTSFSISDPLTAHTGTEQALTILRSAAVRSLFQLHQEDLELLVNISRLTPLRQFYPVHLRVMQQVVWQRDMGFLAQHSQFYLTVKALLKQADAQKQLYCPDSAPSFVKSLPQLDEALLKYDLVNSAWTRAPGFGAGDFVTTHDRTYRGRGHNWNMKRANACFATSKAILSGSSSMPSINVRLNPHQLQGHLWRCFLPAGTVQGPKKPIPPLYPSAFDVAWLHNPKAVLVHICHIHTLLSQRSFATRHKVMSWLSSMAFEANSRTPEPFNILILQMLVAFVLISEMAQIAPPVFDSFDVGAGYEFIAADIREIVEGGAREYWECPESRLAQLAREDDDDVKERRAKAYREKMGGLVNGFISCLQEQWACASPTSPTGTEYETYFLVNHILSQARQKYATWYANRCFHDYLGRIAKAMARQPVSPFMEAPKPLPACGDDRRRSIKGFISMDDILANHQPPAISLGVRPILWLPETAATTLKSHAASSGRIRSLVQRLRSQASSEFEERYSKDLDDSVKALQEVSVQAPISPKDLDTVKQALVSHSAECCRHRDSLYSALEDASVGVYGAAGRQTAPLPRICPRLFLSQLAPFRWGAIPAAWKSVLIQYALSIHDVQRAERLLASSGSANDLAAQLANPGHTNWDPSEFPFALLIEVESNITIRAVQIDIAQTMINPPDGRNSVMQLNMGEGKSSLILPVVAAALANGSRLVRVILAKPQAKQGREMLLSKLGGLLNIKIHQLPFSRVLRLGPAQVSSIAEDLRACQSEGGILLVQPEHLLSFKLMGLECLITGKASIGQELLRTQHLLDATSRYGIPVSKPIQLVI